MSDLATKLLKFADEGDFGLKPDPRSIIRQAAGEIAKLEAELNNYKLLCTFYTDLNQGKYETPVAVSKHNLGNGAVPYAPVEEA